MEKTLVEFGNYLLKNRINFITTMDRKLSEEEFIKYSVADVTHGDLENFKQLNPTIMENVSTITENTTAAEFTVEMEKSILLSQIQSLQEDKTKLQKALDEATSINVALNCLTTKVAAFLNDIQANYVKDGKWVNIGIGGFITLGKKTFTFVKDVLENCFNVKFNPRVPTWLSPIIDFISRNF
jgi:hypothetical protein